MTIPIYRPYVFLRCKKCGRKTDHVLINTETQMNSGKSYLEEIYECQGCGEIKRIFEFTTSHVHSPSQHPRQEGMKETKKKEPMEVTVKEVPASQQPKKPEEQKEKKQEKKKRKWF